MAAALPDQLSHAPWGALIYMGVLSTSFPLLLEFFAFQNVSASLAALIYTAEPLWGAGPYTCPIFSRFVIETVLSLKWHCH